MSDRLRRLLLVVPTARAHPGISIAELAASLDCSVKDLRDDIGLLACVGVPPFQPDDLIDIELRDDRVYVTLPRGFDRPMSLLWTEAAALTIAARTLSPGDPVVRSALEKVARAVASNQTALFETLIARVPEQPPAASEAVSDALNGAIKERRPVEIEYYARTEMTSRRRIIRPRAIVTANGVAYLSARNEKEAERLYRLDRISRVTAQEAVFDPLPAFDIARELKRMAQLEAQTDFPRATVLFSRKVAQAAKARHPGGREKGSAYELDLPYSTKPWLVSYVLSWGGEAMITGPFEAKDALRQGVEAAITANADI
jgi:proteasome accessory factor C